MNRKIIQSLLLPLCLAGLPASGANHVVQVGEKIQDAITAAASGDVVIVRDGLHIDQGYMVIDKPIRLVREKGATVTIRGTSLTFRDLNNSTVLRDFRIENPLTIVNCKQFGIEDVDLSINSNPRYGNVTITNSNVIIRSSKIRNFGGDMDDSSVEIIDSQITYDISGDRNNLQVVNSTFRHSEQTDSNSTFVKSTSTEVGNFTRGSFVSHGSTFGGVVTFTSCDWASHGTTFQSNLTSNNSHTKLLRSHVLGTLTHQHKMAGTSPDYALDCVVFQSSVNALISVAKRTWVTYSSVGQATIGADTEEAYFTGNTLVDKVTIESSKLELEMFNNAYNPVVESYVDAIFLSSSDSRNAQFNTDTGNRSWYTAKTYYFKSGTKLPVVTNQIYRGSYGNTFCYAQFFYTDGTNARSNTATDQDTSWNGRAYFNPYANKEVTKLLFKLRNDNNSGRGHERKSFCTVSNPLIHIRQAKSVRFINNSGLTVAIENNFGGTSEIRGNIFYNSGNKWNENINDETVNLRRWAISAPVPGISQDNYFQRTGGYGYVTGGINNDLNVVVADPGFVYARAGNYALKSDSMLKDKGPADPQFNDHDGSRNDIGQYGGHAYDVNGTTSVNPVVLSGTQNIFRMRVGETSPIQIKARAAVATPAQ
jgi:hypothetical protein